MRTTRRAWHRLAAAGLCAALAAATLEAKVQSCRFAAASPPPVYRVPGDAQQLEPILRPSLERMPEGDFIDTALSVGAALYPLSANERTNVMPKLRNAYARIESDPDFARVQSALPYCFAAAPNSNGHYFMCRPAIVPKRPKTIIFLHGFGGNLLLYTWLLKEEFPTALILAPSWGASWYNGSMPYLKDMIRDAERRTGAIISMPLLVGISAAGPVGFRIYNANPTSFCGYVCLASAPDSATTTNLLASLRVLMINGSTDDMAPIAEVRSRATLARHCIPSLETKELPADHFFLLTRRAETCALIRKFWQTKPAQPAPAKKPVRKRSGK